MTTSRVLELCLGFIYKTKELSGQVENMGFTIRKKKDRKERKREQLEAEYTLKALLNLIYFHT